MKIIAKAKQDFTIFKFGAHKIRVIDRSGEPWFVAQDVCSALSIKNVTQAIERLDEDERSMLNIGRQGEANIVSESGMYTLVLRCRDAVNKGSVPHQFRKWVTAEVLPSIRKHGEYKSEELPVSPVQAIESRYRVRVIIYDDVMGGCVELFGKGETMRDIAWGVASDLGYQASSFTQVQMNKEKVRRVF
ncbi:MAG: Bro-N domain-containing protein [Pluralibacter sp.]|nr:Bro-N domain-containing protein [Pluralibacter sp.]QIU92158.1 antirepressor protein ant [Yokenella regensburgei]